MVWDIQDRTSWELTVPMWQMTGTTPVHNLFIKGNYAYISYYKQGLVVLDITDPTNPFMAGWYDTYTPTTGTYNGAWGCYPYLPSGNILISDINSGLWVLDFLLDPTTPVELTSFTYSLNDYKINLEWVTASEINNSGYDVQRSTDKINWQKIGFVPGKGTTTEKSSYTYTDFSPLAGKSFYRLAQIDFDGTINIEKEIEVDFLSLPKFELAQNYPNPFNPSTKISFTIPDQQNVTLKVFNSLGEQISTLVNEIKPAGVYTVNFDASALPSGLYVTQLQTGNDVQTIKMSLVK
ncbi:MAG: T9SS type A sorting domain-containing protein [Ignavibacteriales bacterium]|nr:T9SS type A sorting domain-containing protein [Ignavibacteriales bacterium]